MNHRPHPQDESTLRTVEIAAMIGLFAFLVLLVCIAALMAR